MNEEEDSLQLFLKGFAARDLAEPLPSFDDTAPPSRFRKAMKGQQAEAVGVRTSGVIAGWIIRDDVMNDHEPVNYRPFASTSVIPDTASLNEVVQGLNSNVCLFVRAFGQISGYIRRNDLQKPPMRMWLFGLVTITELRVTRLIDEICPRGAWQNHLSDGRLQKAQELLHERCRRGQRPSLLDCLQFADKGRIVARNDQLRQRTQFSSRREVEEFVMALQDLRNNLAHSQDISSDWNIIHELATNLHRIVLGPPTASDSVSLSPLTTR